ncbi:MAG TPA: hypothetical protein VFG54_06920 [Prolixibacteraceae bacterium]|nr:hypothetical protein [Prolixibacteraceae bacterium]
MKYKLIIIGLLISLNGFTQSIEQLELKLRHTSILELDSVRLVCNQIFKLDKYNELAIDYLMESYRYQTDDPSELFYLSGREKLGIDTTINSTDSINVFFKNLIENDKTNPMPLILVAKYKYGRTFPSDSNRIIPLEKAIELDKDNIEANFLLGQTYYFIFIKEFKKDSNNSDLEGLATKSFNRLEQAFILDSPNRELLKYPLIQLANYLGNSGKSKHYSLYKINSHLYFPIMSLGSFPEIWNVNYEINIMQEVDLALFVNRWYSSHLKAMNEPIMYKDYWVDNSFRFTWLRTFHNPIAIRIDKDKEQILLTWKECDGAGGYEPGKIIVDKQKKLSENEWKEFQRMISKIDFWEMPTTLDEIPGSDGSQWILEGIKEGEYHVVDRWTPRGSEYAKCCGFLLNLTDIKINEKEKY